MGAFEDMLEVFNPNGLGFDYLALIESNLEEDGSKLLSCCDFSLIESFAKLL